MELESELELDMSFSSSLLSSLSLELLLLDERSLAVMAVLLFLLRRLCGAFPSGVLGVEVDSRRSVACGTVSSLLPALYLPVSGLESLRVHQITSVLFCSVAQDTAGPSAKSSGFAAKSLTADVNSSRCF